MKKINIGIILSSVVLTGFCFWARVYAQSDGNADNSAVAQDDNQVLNDEGYGNADTEYYNSEDVNDVNDTTGNDAQ